MDIDLTNIESDLRAHKIFLPQPLPFKLKNAKAILEKTMRHFVGEAFRWIPEYDEIVDWLSDTQGKGLFLYGHNGNGKTVLCQRALPAIFYKCMGRVISCYDYNDINNRLDEALERRLISIDDIGNEEMVNSYGNKRFAIPELMDRAEKRGNLVIISTNLGKGGTVGEEGIIDKYGTRTFERICAITRRIQFTQNSLRPK